MSGRVLNGGDFLVNLLIQLLERPFCLFGTKPQDILKLLADLGVEDEPVKGFLFITARLQQPEKIALGNHHHLPELIPGKADDLFDPVAGFADVGDDLSGWKSQLHGSRYRGGAGAPPLGPLIGGAAPDQIGFVPVAEGQLHKGFLLRGGKVTAQHGAVAAGAAGFAVQGKGDGVKNGGFTSAGVAGYQEDAFLAQLGQVQLYPPGIGPERLDDKFFRSHASSSN